MIRISIKNKEVCPIRLEALKQELAQIGVNSFSYDFMENSITLIRHCPLGECDVRCALEKAGFQDLCLEVSGKCCSISCLKKLNRSKN